MKIQCDCGKFQAELTKLPMNSPGRVVCYCDDCQCYLEKINREDVLDDYGGTEIIPVYPCEFEFIDGKENLKCNRLNKNGLNRWSTICCNSPIANTQPNIPWVGTFHRTYTREDPKTLKKLGEIKSRIFGKYARGNPPFKIPEKMDLRTLVTVAPFIIRGKLLKKHKNSPFFEDDGVTPISEVHVFDNDH